MDRRTNKAWYTVSWTPSKNDFHPKNHYRMLHLFLCKASEKYERTRTMLSKKKLKFSNHPMQWAGILQCAEDGQKTKIMTPRDLKPLAASLQS